jgi:ribose-phosphate pyrophosphokinase
MIYINGTPLNVTMFPDNTSQVWKVSTLEIPDTNWVHVKWEYSHEGEFMQLAQLKTLLDAKGFRSALRIKYLPYGRQDKEVSNTATFALRTFASLLNTLGFEEVIIMDPHSEIALDLIVHSRAEYPGTLIGRVGTQTNAYVVCYPDKGAVAKYTKKYSFPYIYGEKVRDQLTGNILSYELMGFTEDMKGKSILIVDDICDGGMTFKILAKDLLAAGAKEVNLFVTHGIFSKGIRTLNESGINKVFTQDGQAIHDKNGPYALLPFNKQG